MSLADLTEVIALTVAGSRTKARDHPKHLPFAWIDDAPAVDPI